MLIVIKEKAIEETRGGETLYKRMKLKADNTSGEENMR